MNLKLASIAMLTLTFGAVSLPAAQAADGDAMMHHGMMKKHMKKGRMMQHGMMKKDSAAPAEDAAPQQ